MYFAKHPYLCKAIIMFDFISVMGYNMNTYLFLLFCLAVIVQLLFVLLIYGRLGFHKEKKRPGEQKGVSILIAARNESENIFKFLPFILEQDYPEFEVIIINHQSTDDSKFILNAYQRQYSNLRIIEIEKSHHISFGKKLPLTLGVKGAKYDQLLLTDTDCQPTSNQWLKSMQSHFTNKHQIVLGYGPYSPGKGWVNRLICFDTAWIAMNYLSFAKVNMPYMGIGRNMAYTKEVFNKVVGFKSHSSISSGDDDLFIQEAAKNKNYTINIDPDSFCYSKAEESWKDWIAQKSRHYTTVPKYKVIKKMMLGIYPLSMLIMLGTFVSLLLDSNFLLIVVALFTFNLLIKWLIIGLVFQKLKESKFIALMPLLDIGYAILTPIMYYTTDKANGKKW